MRVGVYIDGYNLYYAGRGWFGRGTSGWKWLSPRSLATALIAERQNWTGAHIHRIIYCTARVDAKTSPSQHHDQEIYLRAIQTFGAVDHIEFGHYVAHPRNVALCQPSTTTGRPELIQPTGSNMSSGLPTRTATDRETGLQIVIASALIREEKGSDVNLATHLLLDVLTDEVDAAVVISNDSDLALPIRKARERVPVGTINPSRNQTAGALRGQSDEGVGRHWWRKLTPTDFTTHQMPALVGRLSHPDGW